MGLVRYVYLGKPKYVSYPPGNIAKRIWESTENKMNETKSNKSRSPRKESIINKKSLKQYLLRRSDVLRTEHYRFTRVSEETFIELETRFRAVADSFIKSLPAKKGTTMKP